MGKYGGFQKNKTVENGACSIDRVIITKRTREVIRQGRSVASRKMRNGRDAGGEVQRMTKVDRGTERDERRIDKVGTGVESGVRRHARGY